MKNKNRWSSRARAMRNLMQAAEMRGYKDMAERHREKLNQELKNNENQQAD